MVRLYDLVLAPEHHPLALVSTFPPLLPSRCHPIACGRVQFLDRLAYYSIQTVRASFDLITGYHPDRMNREKWLTRIIFLETVAGVPGMMGAMIRHLHSLRLMRRDHGWIHTLLEEVPPCSALLLLCSQARSLGLCSYCTLFPRCYSSAI